jgi:carbonic anhydrase
MPSFPADLRDRYHRFKFRHFAPNQEHYEELAREGQHPDTMIVSCCDSRCDPETIFSAMPGEIFVVRNVANLVPPFETSGKYHGVSAALEFATLTLRVKDIVVLAHSGCGGVQACINRDAIRQTEAQFIVNWMSLLDESRDRVLAELAGRPADEVRAAMEQETVRTSLNNLRTFPCIQALERKGRLSLHGAYFDIRTGVLTALNDATNEFVNV